MNILVNAFGCISEEGVLEGLLESCPELEFDQPTSTRFGVVSGELPVVL